MKLSEIIHYRGVLEEMTPMDASSQIDRLLGPIVDIINKDAVTISEDKIQLQEHLDQIQCSLQGFTGCLEQIKEKIDLIIKATEPTLFRESYVNYEEAARNISLEIIKNRMFDLKEETLKFIDSRIKVHSNWKFSGLIVRPGFEPWINNMVALDPLYMVDVDYDFFDPVKKNFNKKYIERVRWCIIANDPNRSMLHQIPDQQIGFALVYNFFHYAPFEIIKSYLTEIHHKLLPGGTLAFTFNDCDRRGGVVNAERGFMCYTPGKLIRSLIENLGFDITRYHVIDSATTWVEVQKPGKSHSLRGGQTLAKVVAKSK